jgi:hypothetical protein
MPSIPGTWNASRLAARHALPAIFPYREYALTGGLMSYGSSFRDGPNWTNAALEKMLQCLEGAHLPVVLALLPEVESGVVGIGACTRGAAE